MGLVEARISESIEVKQSILADKDLLRKIEEAGKLVKQTFVEGGKVYLCGNGGSASDSIHIAAELSGRFQKERKSLPALSLNADVAALTAISNDYCYDQVFERILSGIVHEKDVLIGISTSGNSENVYRAIVEAKKHGSKTIGLIGKDGGKIKDVADVSIIVPCDNTARIQESHIMIGHIICEIAEEDYE
ncbi:SIS domain-containing protein [Butyrivibrio fibrisolvens]|uniref:D-sedoheptulose-7-phosphate isomerase n=1 Tax=Pseudobutyrivibrio ruminis TaxID=46206 RepID=UPI0004199819|nr:SIS domain-containing protein [Pseudobutyrivibrio ruminis]MDC7279101.1 SIS domain-containing protein [Butyrivibrio fibrisolvens]